MRLRWYEKPYYWVPLVLRRPRVGWPLMLIYDNTGPFRAQLVKVTKLKKNRKMLTWEVDVNDDGDFKTLKTFTGDGEAFFWMRLPACPFFFDLDEFL